MIRSLSRGLDVLALLNRRDSATAAEIAKALDAPRATVYRILETLMQKGFIYQHNSDRRFRITHGVRALSDGFTDEAHMANISHPFLSRVTRKLRWPVSLATIAGIEIIIRENTDNESPLTTERFTIGFRMPVLRTASGLCILAHMAPSRRNVILKTLAEAQQSSRYSAKQRGVLDKTFAKIKSQGYAVHHRPQRISDLTALAVPIVAGRNKVHGAVTIRYARTVATQVQAVHRFVPDLREAAAGIAQRINLHIERQKKGRR